jgi:hypothetical protein
VVQADEAGTRAPRLTRPCRAKLRTVQDINFLLSLLTSLHELQSIRYASRMRRGGTGTKRPRRLIRVIPGADAIELPLGFSLSVMHSQKRFVR